MSVTVVATVGDPTANAYLTVAEGDTLLGPSLFAPGWNKSGRSTDAKGSALIDATRWLDAFQYEGMRATDTQALEFPRERCWDKQGLNYIPNNTIPADLKMATAQLADYLLTESDAGRNPFKESGLSKFTSIAVGGLSLGIAANGVTTAAIPAAIAQRIAWLRMSPDTVRLERA